MLLISAEDFHPASFIVLPCRRLLPHLLARDVPHIRLLHYCLRKGKVRLYVAIATTKFFLRQPKSLAKKNPKKKTPWTHQVLPVTHTKVCYSTFSFTLVPNVPCCGPGSYRKYIGTSEVVQDNTIKSATNPQILPVTHTKVWYCQFVIHPQGADFYINPSLPPPKRSFLLLSLQVGQYIFIGLPSSSTSPTTSIHNTKHKM